LSARDARFWCDPNSQTPRPENATLFAGCGSYL
jgi:hypothetical protein